MIRDAGIPNNQKWIISILAVSIMLPLIGCDSSPARQNVAGEDASGYNQTSDTNNSLVDTYTIHKRRLSRTEMDLDNNGVTDASIHYYYDSSGFLTNVRYSYVGDETEDKFNVLFDSKGETTADTTQSSEWEYIWSAENIFSGEIITSGNTQSKIRITYLYDNIRRIDAELFNDVGEQVDSNFQLYSYTDNRLKKVEGFNSNGERSSVIELIYNTAGSPENMVKDTPSTEGNIQSSTVYAWNADGSLDSQVEIISLNDQEVGRYTRSNTYTNGVLTARNSASTNIEFVEDMGYEKGLLVSISYDLGLDGIVDAVSTNVWEDGDCIPYYTNRIWFAPFVGSDGIPGSAMSDTATCAE